jgi:hypothetical protein
MPTDIQAWIEQSEEKIIGKVTRALPMSFKKFGAVLAPKHCKTISLMPFLNVAF